MLVLISYHSQKQGILPLWFSDKADYSRISAGDRIETAGLADLLAGSGKDIQLQITKQDGQSFLVKTFHTMSPDQLKWLEAGSALNYIRAMRKAAEGEGSMLQSSR